MTYDIQNDYLSDEYEELGLDLYSCLSDPNRRLLFGRVLALEGMSGTNGDSAAIAFESECAVIDLQSSRRLFVVDYDSSTALRVGGRGLIQTSHGGGFMGGGFGVQGALVGMLAASALNSLTTQTSSQIETIATFTWDGGGIALRNSSMLPGSLSHRLRPVLAAMNMRAGSPDESEDSEAVGSHESVEPTKLADQLERLAELHRSGALTNEEFSTAKARLLET